MALSLAAQKECTKVVIRNLPPLLQEEEARALISHEFKDKVTWFYFAQGKLRCAPHLLMESADVLTIGPELDHILTPATPATL